MKKIVVFSLLTAFLSACTSRYATDGEHTYLSSKNGPDLVVPAPLAANTSHFYDLPAQKKNAVVSIAPPSAAAAERQTA